MLLQNITYLSSYPTFMTGGTLAGELTGLGAEAPSNFACRFSGGVSQLSSIPTGYTPGDAWGPPLKSGDMALFRGIDGQGILSSGVLAGGLNGSSTINGVGSFSDAALGLIASMAATIAGLGDFSSNPIITGKIEAVATIIGTGSVSASLGALADLVSTIFASSSLTLSPHAAGSLSATIYVNEGTATMKQMAGEVWNSLAADFNTAGTMGEKLNAAGTAGDPWTANLSGYTGNQAGAQVLTKGKFLALK